MAMKSFFRFRFIVGGSPPLFDRRLQLQVYISLMSGTSGKPIFGGPQSDGPPRRGIVDGFVYLGSGRCNRSASAIIVTYYSWPQWWPNFPYGPFALIGGAGRLAPDLARNFPDATRVYIETRRAKNRVKASPRD